MKKSVTLLLLIFITSCDKNDELPTKSQALNNPMQLYIINGDIEYYSEITDGSKPKKPIFLYDLSEKTNKINNLTSKSSEQSVTINFNYGIGDSTKSGCTIERFNNGNPYSIDYGVYGPNPFPFPNPDEPLYSVRGYGQPHHNFYYNSLVLFVGNKGYKSPTRRGIVHKNKQHGSAISIEYPFKPNVTYEISIKASFHDNRYLIDKVFSSGYPTFFAQLKDSGIIPTERLRDQTQDPCDQDGVISLDKHANNYPNYTRSYTLDSPSISERNLVFKFSPTEEKKALILSLHPAIGIEGYGTPIPTNNFTMRLPFVIIKERPFDPSLNIELPPEKPYNPRR